MKRKRAINLISIEPEPQRERFADDPHVWKSPTEPLEREEYRDGSGYGTRKLAQKGDVGISGNWWGRQRSRW